MKAIVSLVVLISAHAAMASFFQTVCTSPDGHISVTDGQMSNKIMIGVFDSQSHKTSQVDMTWQVESVDLEKTNLSHDETQNCSVKSIDYKLVQFTKNDGSNFPAGTVGVSKDLKTVTAHLLCEYNANSRGLCH